MGHKCGEVWETIVGDKSEISANHLEWKSSARDKCGDKCKLIPSKAPGVGNKCENKSKTSVNYAWETTSETSVNSQVGHLRRQV